MIDANQAAREWDQQLTDLASAQSAHNRISKLGRDAVKDLHKVGREQANAFQQTIRRGISKLLDKALLVKKLTIEQKIRIADTRVRLMKDAINGFDAATKKVPETMGRIRARLWKDFRKQNIAFLSAEGVRRLLTNVRRGWAYQRRGKILSHIGVQLRGVTSNRARRIIKSMKNYTGYDNIRELPVPKILVYE